MKISVENFGPVVSGEVELKPLTIFVGPNGSGKSYIAMLTYALLHHSSFGRLYGFPFSIRRLLSHRLAESGDGLSEFNDWLSVHFEEGRAPGSVDISRLPTNFVEVLEANAELWIGNFINSSKRELTRCFGAELNGLSRLSSDAAGFRISLEHSDPDWSMAFSPDEGKFPSERLGPAFKTGRVDLFETNRLVRRRQLQRRFQNFDDGVTDGVTNEVSTAIAEQIFGQLFGGMIQQFPGSCYYLPAARSGFLQSHKLLASAIVSRAPFAGIEPFPTARLTGAVADFIGGLLTIESDEETDLFDIAKFLEQNIADGQITMEAAGVEYPEISFSSQGSRYLLHQTSSMVSEIAPLVLYLKHTIDPGDLLIIEEPESHLHPYNQRRLAWGIVKMIRRGLRVILTTHSDYFLSQLSNFVRLSELEDERARLNYDPDDFLTPEDVGCYLFELHDGGPGSVIRSLDINVEDGIPEDEFSEISESLYNEYVDLEYARTRHK